MLELFFMLNSTEHGIQTVHPVKGYHNLFGPDQSDDMIKQALWREALSSNDVYQPAQLQNFMLETFKTRWI